MATPNKRMKPNPTNTSGIHCGIRGNEYQIYMTMYMLLRAYNKCSAYDFALRMERPEPEVGKFDDIWLKIDDEQMFVQVKHVSGPDRLTKGKFLTEAKDAPFSLFKYSQSFDESRKLAAPTGQQKWWCILLTNLPLCAKFQNRFEAFDVDCKLSKIMINCSLLHLKSKDMLKILGSSKEFHKDFVLSLVKSSNTISTTGKYCFQELQREIQNEIEENIFEDAEHAFNRLRVKLVKWVCNRIKREQEHIDRQWLVDFFENIKRDYKSIIEAYHTELRDKLELYEHVSIDQQKIDDLKRLMEEEKIILLSFKESSMARLKQVYQCCIQSKEIKKRFKFILSSRLQNDSTKTKMKNALKDTGENVLVVLDDREKVRNFFEFLQSVEDACANIIILTQQTSIFETIFKTQNITYKLDSKDITMEDFDQNTINVLANYSVMFQGIEIFIKDLPNSVGFHSSLTGDRLEALVDGYEISIGNSLPSVEARCSHYVTRNIKAIRPYYNLNEMRQDCNVTIVESASEVDSNSDANYVAIIESEEDLIAIKNNIFTRPKRFTVFKKMNNDFGYIRATLGNPWQWETNFHKFRTSWSPVSSGKSELEFNDLIESFPRSVIILSDDIGTGKSTTLLRFANMLKESNPSSWVIFIDLNTETARNEEFLDTDFVSKDFVIKLLSNLASPEADRPYFMGCLGKEPQNVVVYLDAFDEACPSYKKGVLKFIDILVDLKVRRIIISTRTQFEDELMEHFSTISYSLKRMNNEQQRELMEALWQVEGRMCDNTNKIIEKMNEKFKDIMQGVPLVIQILSKIPPNELEKFLSGNFTLYNLFEAFLDNILKRYFTEKSKMNIKQNTIRSKDIPKLQEIYNRDFSLIAIKSIFSNDNVARFFTKHDQDEWDNLSQESIANVTCSEIITEARFIHRAYAEFYAAAFIYAKFAANDDMSQFWEDFRPVLVTKGLVSAFFYQKLDSRYNEQMVPKITKIFEQVTYVPLRYQCEKNYALFLKHFLQNEMNNEIIYYLTKLLSKSDPLNAIKAAIRFKQISLAKNLLKAHPSLTEKINSDGQTLLHVAAQSGCFDLVDELITNHGLSALVPDRQGSSPAMLAYKSKQYEVASFLLNGCKVSLKDCKATEARNMVVLLILNLPDFHRVTIKIVEQNEKGFLLELNNDFILITTDYGGLNDYIQSIRQKNYTVNFDEICDEQDSTQIINFLTSAYPDKENMFQKPKNDYSFDVETNSDMLFNFNQRFKLFTVGYTREDFIPQTLKQISVQTFFSDANYVILRIQQIVGNFFSGKELMHEALANELILKLYQEAVHLHSEEAKLKYCSFRFRNPVLNVGNLELVINQKFKQDLYIIRNSIESARVIQYLGNRIKCHVLGEMLRNDKIFDMVINHIDTYQVIFVHNLGCKSKNIKPCKDCKSLSSLCFPTKCKAIVALKHSSTDSCEDSSYPAVEDLNDKTIKSIKDYGITRGSHYLHFGELSDNHFKFCIKHGALEYIAQNDPINLGQTQPLYFLSWHNQIRKLNDSDPLAESFYESLDVLLNQKFSVVSKPSRLLINTCEKCQNETYIFPNPVTMLSAEASWRQKDKLVLNAHLFSLPEFPNCTDPIELLLKWYPTEEDDPLSNSWVEIFLSQQSKDVILIIDTFDVDLEPTHVNALKNIFFDKSNFHSVIVCVDSEQNREQILANISSAGSFELYHLPSALGEKKMASMPEHQVPSGARVCDHFRQHPFEICENYL